MKKLLLSLLACASLLSCSNDDNDDNNLSNSPTATASYDSKNYGIYKGVFVGSTGTIVINLKNNGTTLSATLVIDGTSYTYTSQDAVTEGSNTEITFTHNNDYFDFTVNANGTNPTVSNIHISGHPEAAINVGKEESDVQVYCYVGTFIEDGITGGTWNLIIYGNKVTGMVLPNDGQVLPFIVGTISNNTITASIPDTATITGTLNGNTITGNWVSSTGSGTWKSTRKL
ncbi:hypothetical protein [Flavobacterium commune]|uniref:Uncharacterized protein n=1 Tax=Flavobacterium commune TaxID=1306519 RepID=A0A1D9PD50_9FLAO|nr:hypothetical protein [Flavobacterium commune]APA00510.1 hypothetical protein BIW12_14360 [Flavobacterium commune]